MALTKAEANVKFGGVNQKVASTTAEFLSDEYAVDVTAAQAAVAVACSTAGTPAAGDYADVYILYDTGTGAGAGNSTQAFDTAEHGTFIGRLDCYASDTPGENPAQLSRPVSVVPRAFKLRIIPSANAATRNQTFNAVVTEQRSA